MTDILLGDPNIPDEEQTALDSDNEHENNIDGVAEQDNTEENNENQDQENEVGTVVPPKPKRVIKNPRPKLDPDRLCGPRGIAVLEKTFENVKFKGPGYEKEDLDLVMKKLEHWGHRLFPLYQFDDFLQKVEIVGKKKPVQTHIKKIRLGMNTQHEEYLLDAGVDEDEPATVVEEDLFDTILRNGPGSNFVDPDDQPPAVTIQPPPPVVLTEEQQERMLRNRQLAIERREARLKAKKLQLEVQQLQDTVVEGANSETNELNIINPMPTVNINGDNISVSAVSGASEEQVLTSDKLSNNSPTGINHQNKSPTDTIGDISDSGERSRDMNGGDVTGNRENFAEEEMLELISSGNPQ